MRLILISAVLLGLLGLGAPLAGLQASSDARPLEQAYSCPTLDTFNRTNGSVGAAWSGQTANYAIAGNQLDVLTGSTIDAGRIIWNAGAFASVQQACVKLAAIDTGSNASVQLVLKNATSSDVSSRMMTVTYRPSTSTIRVETYDSASGSILRGTEFTSVTFVSGDMFGARVLSSGSVEVYRNSTLLGTRDASAWSFINQTGYIGLRVDRGPSFFLDDFGGGTVSTSSTATPTRTNTPGSGYSCTGNLDTFSRVNGPIGTAWSGQTANYAIASNQLDIVAGSTSDAGRIIWNAGAYAAAQQACVRLAAIDNSTNASVQLVLKNATSSDVSGRMLTITYLPSAGIVKVETYDSSNGWVLRGTDMTGVTFAAGDMFGSRVLSNGLVEVYRNTTLLGNRDASAWSFISQTGYIGLRVNKGPGFFLDDFGGGSASGVSPTFTPTPTNTQAPPTSTPLPPTNTPTAEPAIGYPGPGDPTPELPQSISYRLYMPQVELARYWSQSYYVADTGLVPSLGSQLAVVNGLVPGAQDNLVILMFGVPDSVQVPDGTTVFGTRLYDQPRTFRSTDSIRTSVVGFAQNYLSSVPDSSALRLVVGTYPPTATTTVFLQQHGARWGQMMNDIRDALTPAQRTRVTIVAGADIENQLPEFFAGPVGARAWQNSFALIDNYPSEGSTSVNTALINFGNNLVIASNNADCTANETEGIWNACDVWTSAWDLRENGVRFVRPVGQVYSPPDAGNPYGYQALNWRDLSYWQSVVYRNTQPILFAGTISQAGACVQIPSDPNCQPTTNGPSAAYNLLRSALATVQPVVQAAPPRWLTDIRYQWTPTPLP